MIEIKSANNSKAFIHQLRYMFYGLNRHDSVGLTEQNCFHLAELDII